MEEQVWDFVSSLLQQPQRIKAGLDRLIEEEESGAQGDPKQEAEYWSRRITEAEVERRGYQRLAAKGHMTEEELGAALTELDEIHQTAQRELEAARAHQKALENLQHDRDTVLESYAGIAKETLGDLAPEERHRVYKLLRLNVYSRPDVPLEINGTFVSHEGEGETGVCRTANSGHFAYKGVMICLVSEGMTSGVR